MSPHLKAAPFAISFSPLKEDSIPSQSPAQRAEGRRILQNEQQVLGLPWLTKKRAFLFMQHSLPPAISSFSLLEKKLK